MTPRLLLSSFIMMTLFLLAGCKGAFTPPPPASPLDAGRRIYQMRCVSCHFPNGSGLLGDKRFAGDFTRPDGILTKTDAELLHVISEGYQGQIGRMPAFKPVMTHEEMQQVLHYIRTTFGQPKPKKETP